MADAAEATQVAAEEAAEEVQEAEAAVIQVAKAILESIDTDTATDKEIAEAQAQ